MANIQACYLYSKANYSIIVEYGEGSLVVPPNAKQLLIKDKSKLGLLPNTIKIIDIKEGK